MTKSHAWELATRRQRRGKDKPINGVKHGLVEKKKEAPAKLKTPTKMNLLSLAQFCKKRLASGKTLPCRNAFRMKN